MTQPTPTPAPAPAPKKSWADRLKAVVVWANSRQGRAEILAVVGALGSVYDALHRSGAI